MGGKGVGGVIQPSPIGSAREQSERIGLATKTIRPPKPVPFKHFDARRGSLVVVVEAMGYACLFNTDRS